MKQIQEELKPKCTRFVFITNQDNPQPEIVSPFVPDTCSVDAEVKDAAESWREQY